MIKHDTLLDILLRHAPESSTVPTKIKDFWIARRDTPTNIYRHNMKPVVIIPVQGKWRSIIGKIPYEYGAGQSIVVGITKPADCTVVEASPEKPCLSMILELDAAVIAQILTELPKEDIDEQNLLAVACSKTDMAVFEAFTRLSELLDKPEQIHYLAPLITREIHYRLLTSPMGKHIRVVNTVGTQSNQIACAIAWLENNYKKSLKVEDLAEYANMAVSTFHHNFKQITSLSPLQFQKRLRLLEAQRLMLIERLDAANACFEVGYESPTQFSREYKRMFGNPPLKDIKDILILAT